MAVENTMIAFLPILMLLLYIGSIGFVLYFAWKVIAFMREKNAQDRRTAEILESIARKLDERG